jgi:NAD(P)-dependent dehydrogenase (short-subunit alcohol dehydrogenase family)
MSSDAGEAVARAIARSVGEPAVAEPPVRPQRLPEIAAEQLGGVSAVVTGAARGIGRAVAASLQAAGARIVAADIASDLMVEVAQEMGSDGGRVVPYGVDVTDVESVEQLMAHAAQQLGTVEVVVHAAGVIHVDDFLHLSHDTWRHVLTVNAGGTFLVTQAAARQMVRQPVHPRLQRRGMVLNISSLASYAGRPTHAAYGASKAAVNHVSRSAAAALSPHRIATAVACPGNVREGMWRDLASRIAQLEGVTSADVESGRYFQPADEFAEVVRDACALPGMSLNGALVLYDREIAEI